MSAKAGPGNTCPDCGGKPEKMTQNLANSDIVYACAAGHEWVSDEGKAPPVQTGMVEEKPKNRKSSRD